jgi:hypothetical protein
VLKTDGNTLFHYSKKNWLSHLHPGCRNFRSSTWMQPMHRKVGLLRRTSPVRNVCAPGSRTALFCNRQCKQQLFHIPMPQGCRPFPLRIA